MTQQENDRLTRVGPSTPMGNLLRRYWQPIATAVELEIEPVQKVRLLGEDLTAFRTERGEFGLIGDRCPHRGCSFEYGIPQQFGLRCAYHGWLFDTAGRCIDQPFETTVDPVSRGKSLMSTPSYQLQELGGLVFAYMGPEPAPLLPRWDLLVREDLDRVIEIHELPCNWVQCMDNAADPVHFEHLHARFGNYQMKKLGQPPAMTPTRHLKIEFDEFPYGIIKRRLLEGESEDSGEIDEWTTGHPILFPNILAVGSTVQPTLQFRVAKDDVTTMQYAYRTNVRDPGTEPRPIVARRSSLFEADGRIRPDSIPKQDMLAWVGQGPITDRTREHLARSDKGVVMYHQMLMDQMDRIERGEEPKAVIRDPAENEPWIDIRREQITQRAFHSQYGDYFEQVTSLAER